MAKYKLTKTVVTKGKKKPETSTPHERRFSLEEAQNWVKNKKAKLGKGIYKSYREKDSSEISLSANPPALVVWEFQKIEDKAPRKKHTAKRSALKKKACKKKSCRPVMTVVKESPRKAHKVNLSALRKKYKRIKRDNSKTQQEQFNDIKSKHPEYLILFRHGNTFITYGEDIDKVENALGKKSFPVSEFSRWIDLLVKWGYKVYVIGDVNANN